MGTLPKFPRQLYFLTRISYGIFYVSISFLSMGKNLGNAVILVFSGSVQMNIHLRMSTSLTGKGGGGTTNTAETSTRQIVRMIRLVWVEVKAQMEITWLWREGLLLMANKMVMTINISSKLPDLLFSRPVDETQFNIAPLRVSLPCLDRPFLVGRIVDVSQVDVLLMFSNGSYGGLVKWRYGLTWNLWKCCSKNRRTFQGLQVVQLMFEDVSMNYLSRNQICFW